MASTLQGAIDFLKEFGLFDVILPFLLVFAIVYALLEKTRILGSEKVGDKEVPKSSLNSTVAFVVALLVVATNKIVTAINIALPNVVLLIVLLVTFLMLVGIFFREGEFDFATRYKGWTTGFAIIILVSIVLIFANSISYKNTSQTWLGVFWDYLVQNYNNAIVGSIIMLIILIGSIVYMTKSVKQKGGE